MRPRPLEWIMEGSCIRCTSHKLDSNGYQRIGRNGKQFKVAREILLRRHGDLLPNQVARHTCDNTWCIRPDHIIIGTQKDNALDRDSRGRRVPLQGDKHGRYIHGLSKTREYLNAWHRDWYRKNRELKLARVKACTSKRKAAR